jgi:class 3 adenylate cyclase
LASEPIATSNGALQRRAIGLFFALVLVPVAASVVVLVQLNRTPLRVSEEMLQASVLTEVATAPSRVVRDAEKDAVAVAAVLGQAAAGALSDDEAIASVRALLGTRTSLDAVRFEIPATHFSTVITRAGATGNVPVTEARLFAVADERGVAFTSTSPGEGLVVVPIPGGTKERRGYVAARADLSRLQADIQAIAEQRFASRDVAILVADSERRAVASFGVGGVANNASAADLPVFRLLPSGTPWATRVGAVAPFNDGGVPVIGSVESIPELGWAVAIWRPEPVAFAALTRMRNAGIAVGLASVVVALLVAFFTARGVTRPILALARAARLIGERRWRDIPPAPKRADEIGDLGRSIDAMAQSLEHGEEEIVRQTKLRGDLGRFLSKGLVDAIVKGEHSLKLGGARTTVSVLFADVVAFTPLAEARPAEQVVALLNELFSLLTEVVFRHGGTVDKFIGDCVMAVWGAPVPTEDHAKKALAAAEDMMRLLETANETWREKYGVEIRLGIGVNSGEAIVGNIGSDKRMEYTVIGDVVNVAARLEALAQPNQVLVAEATATLAGDAFELVSLGSRQLTGRANATAVFALATD